MIFWGMSWKKNDTGSSPLPNKRPKWWFKRYPRHTMESSIVLTVTECGVNPVFLFYLNLKMANCRLSWFSRWVRTKMENKLNNVKHRWKYMNTFKRLDEEMPFPNLCLFWAPSAVLRFFLLKIWKQPQKPTWNPINDDLKWMSFLSPTDLSDKNAPKRSKQPASSSITALLGKPSQPSLEVFVTSSRFGPFRGAFVFDSSPQSPCPS